MKIQISKILSNQQYAPKSSDYKLIEAERRAERGDIFKLVIAFEAMHIAPGQFFMLKTTDGSFLLPRPISVHTADEKSVTFLYRLEGGGTTRISALRSGDELQAFGPLGNGFDLSFDGRAAIVGGGIGIAPLLFLAQKLGKRADVFLGFKNFSYCVEDFEICAGKVAVAAEDGSRGHKGLVTELINYYDYNVIFTCGPEIMMKKVIESARAHKVIAFASLEKRMACGMGACLGCALETKSGIKRVCKDGPIFSANELAEE